MCKAPSIPKPPGIPLPPTPLDPDVLLARDRQRALARRKAGRQGTIFGGGIPGLSVPTLGAPAALPRPGTLLGRS
jgi:hypothetical protein